MKTVRVVVFGSTADSLLVFEPLRTLKTASMQFSVVAAVTQPPRPAGRHGFPVPTPVEAWAHDNKITILTFDNDKEKPWRIADEDAAITALDAVPADIYVSACYGQKIPMPAIKKIPFGGVNVHPSLIPRWRGADPIPWTIMMGDAQTGVTVITLEEKFDHGKILGQKKLPVSEKDEPDALRSKLFGMGAALLADILPAYIDGSLKTTDQDPALACYARKLNREDGFISAATLGIGGGTQQPDGTDSPILTTEMRITDEETPEAVVRMIRALSPWPGVWTLVKIRDPQQNQGAVRRMKILQAHADPAGMLVIDSVQLEGKKPVPFRQFTQAYL